MHDLKIQNARVCDGLGNPITLGTLAVTDGRISGVGLDVGTARHTVDAEGMVLAPGIVQALKIRWLGFQIALHINYSLSQNGKTLIKFI